MSILTNAAKRLANEKPVSMTLEEYLTQAKTDRSLYASPAERMVQAIGEPTIIDTSKDPRLSRIFGNETITEYEAFKDFYGMNKVIEEVVSYFRHSAQGLEESRQILYLLGAVGTAKSSLVTRLTELMETLPIYVLAYQGKLSPVFESPLGLFTAKDSEELGIPARFLTGIASPWAIERVNQAGGNLNLFSVVKLFPSQMKQIAIARVEPGDENNQDQTSIIGKSDMSKLGILPQNHPDAYSYTGGLCIANQGLMEFVEMFKAPIKLLNPLLTATQEGKYKPTESLSLLPFNGIIVAHSNESEWQAFKNNKTNEAFLDRIFIVKVPYVLQVSKEVEIYKKMLRTSELSSAPRAPEVLENLARFAVLTRLRKPSNSDIFTKLKAYDGENMKEQDKGAKSAPEYRDEAGVDEGMSGLSTRQAFKLFSKVVNFDINEKSADNIHLFMVLEDFIKNSNLPKDTADEYTNFLTKYLKVDYLNVLEKEIQRAYLDSHNEYGQNLFNRYLALANHWLDDQDFKDKDTGSLWDRNQINTELEKLEKPAGIYNPREFREDVTRFVFKVSNQGKTVTWKDYNKIADVIEKNMFSKMQDIIPIISNTAKESKDDKRKHSEFQKRMTERGYTATQVKRAVDWFIQNR